MINTGAVSSCALAVYDFHRGTSSHAYAYFGVHRMAENEEETKYCFRFFAPQVRMVWLCGDFLEKGTAPMRVTEEEGIWEAVIDSDISLEGMRYHFSLETSEGVLLSADPYAQRGLWGDEIGSLICTAQSHVWDDARWLRHRESMGQKWQEMPINLYEVHLGSFATQQGRSCAAGDAYLNYRELGAQLADYVSEMGYTHIKLMPLTEYPQDASHGYLASGYFAPTGRYGSPDDLREMVNCLHRAGIGVVMDFPLRAVASGVGEGDWPDPGMGEVQSFWLSAALFWLREFHLDGLCVVGMSEWFSARETGRSAAVDFLRLFCAAIHSEFPDVLLLAGEPVYGERTTGRMGFDLLCYPQFARDVMQYLHMEPARRRYWEDRLMLSLSDALADGERRILPLAHETVCAGHGSLFCRIYGKYLQKFEGVRLCLAYQMVHPGKKLLFMGCELGQLRTWDDSAPLDWFLLDLELHEELQRYVRGLNHFYCEDKRLWQAEHLWEGFCRVEAADGTVLSSSVLACKRFDAAGRELLAIFHFGEEDGLRLHCGVGSRFARYRECFNSDYAVFGGKGRITAGQEVYVDADGMLTLDMPPMTAIFLEPVSVRKAEEP